MQIKKYHTTLGNKTPFRAINPPSLLDVLVSCSVFSTSHSGDFSTRCSLECVKKRFSSSNGI